MKQLYRILPIFISLMVTSLFAQETVYLQSFKYGSENDHGRGIIKTRTGECFIIAPKHVAKDSIGIIGANKVRSSGEVEYIDTKFDLAIVRITGGGQLNCSGWKSPDDFSTILNNMSFTFLEVRDKNGSIENLLVLVKKIDNKSIYIVPKDKDEGYIKGMSGAALFTQYKNEKVFLGMFLAVDSRTNEGVVFRADEMDRVLGGFFNVETDFKFTLEADETNGIKTQLLNCQKIGNTVKCNFKIMSIQGNKEIIIYGRETKIFDDAGVESIASLLTLGKYSGTNNVSYTLIEGVPLDGEIQFNNVNSSGEGLTYIELKYYVSGSGYFNVSFNNVRFSNPEVTDMKISQELMGIKMEIVGCEKSNNTVYCKFRLESMNKNLDVRIYGHNSKLFNQNGIETAVSNITLGDLSNTNNVGYTLIQNIPLEGSVEFTNDKSDISEITFIRLNLYSNETGSINFEFKDVPLSASSGIQGLAGAVIDSLSKKNGIIQKVKPNVDKLINIFKKK